MGDLHGGHYMAYIRPKTDEKWYFKGLFLITRFKFDDDKVTPATLNDVFEHNFGGDYQYTKIGSKVRRMTNAYMLVYILESERLEILRPITEDDMPVHLCIKIIVNISEKN
jgi:ubiquitin carboxyl-terminal hydrolase 7